MQKVPAGQRSFLNLMMLIFEMPGEVQEKDTDVLWL